MRQSSFFYIGMGLSDKCRRSLSFSQTNVPVVVNADIADTVFVTVEGANIVLAEDGSAMNIGANSVIVLNCFDYGSDRQNRY